MKKEMISARIDKDLKDYLDRNNYVITDIVRAGLIQFIKMDIDESIRFLAENRETFRDFQIEDYDWTEIIRNGLAEHFEPDTVDELMKSGNGIIILNKLKELSR